MRIVRRLLGGECTVSAVAGDLGISPYNVSKHLAILRSAGLVRCRRVGRERVYGVAEECRVRTASGLRVMDLGCCSFRIDEMPR